MRIQLVYFEGCPNVDAARRTLREVLAKRGLTVAIEGVCTSGPDAPAELRAWGSPTILIDGLDVGGEVAPGGASCRLYRDATGRLQGIPPPSLMEAALLRAPTAPGLEEPPSPRAPGCDHPSDCRVAVESPARAPASAAASATAPRPPGLSDRPAHEDIAKRALRPYLRRGCIQTNADGNSNRLDRVGVPQERKEPI